MAEAAQLTGRHHEAASALERAFTLRAAAADLHHAATAAFWLYLLYTYAGEFARGSGWMSRLRDLSEQLNAEEEPGWLHIAAAHQLIAQGRYDDARAELPGAVAQGRERGEVDLEAFARMLTGSVAAPRGSTRRRPVGHGSGHAARDQRADLASHDRHPVLRRDRDL